MALICSLDIVIIILLKDAEDVTAVVISVYNYSAQMPQWFLDGMNAAILAPTAMNQQKFRFELLSDGTVKASCGSGFYTKLDLGIVNYHFETVNGKITT